MSDPIGAIGDGKASRTTDAWLKKQLIQPKTQNAEGGGLTPAFLPNGGTFADAVKSLNGTDPSANAGTW